MKDVTLREAPLRFTSNLDHDDAARKADTLNLLPYAEAMRDFIHECETPVSIGIQGGWGVGRTTLMNMLRGSGNGWRPLSWATLIEVMEDIAFSPDTAEPSWNLASLMSRGWIKRDHQAKFFRSVWQTCKISIQEKKLFFRWLYGQHQWSDLPKAPSSYLDESFSLKTAYRLSSAKKPYSARRQKFSRRYQRAFG